jgi:hypothetical protein
LQSGRRPFAAPPESLAALERRPFAALGRQPLAALPKSLSASRRRLPHNQYSFAATSVHHCILDFCPFQLRRGAARWLLLAGPTACLTARAPPTC